MVRLCHSKAGFQITMEEIGRGRERLTESTGEERETESQKLGVGEKQSGEERARERGKEGTQAGWLYTFHTGKA